LIAFKRKRVATSGNTGFEAQRAPTATSPWPKVYFRKIVLNHERRAALLSWFNPGTFNIVPTEYILL